MTSLKNLIKAELSSVKLVASPVTMHKDLQEHPLVTIKRKMQSSE